jgi:sulfide:quinone oxidoreductase
LSQRIVILGAGTGGTLMANRLRRRLARDRATITVIDQDDVHVYQPGLLFVPFGLSQPEDIVRPRARQLHAGVAYVQRPIDHVDLTADEVVLEGDERVPYDALIVATGARLVPEETEGLTGPGWGACAFTFYDLPGATALEGALRELERGRIVVNIVDLPIKCPVAPLEFCFLADWYLRDKGVRAEVELIFATPLDGAFTTPVASRELGGLLAEKEVGLVTEFNTGEVAYDAQGRGGTLIGYDGRELAFDIAVVVPLHDGAAYVGRSPDLGDELDFVPTDPATLQSRARPNVFAIGDAANLPASKAGSVTHFEGEILTDNVLHFLEGRPLDASYDGHANCFIETGFSKALMIDFNYDTEPGPGRFPGPIGVPLLRESRLNHLGKLMFQWFYWHSLLPGRDVPGLGADMPTRGKLRPEGDDRPATPPKEDHTA